MDSLREILDRIRAEAPEIQDGALNRIEVWLRQSYGGGTIYISRQPKRLKQIQIAEALPDKKPTTRSVMLACGFSERTARRLLRGS